MIDFKKTRKPYWSLQDVLEFVPFSRSTLYLMIKAGRFPPARKMTEKRHYWDKKDIQQWEKYVKDKGTSKVLNKIK